MQGLERTSGGVSNAGVGEDERITRGVDHRRRFVVDLHLCLNLQPKNGDALCPLFSLPQDGARAGEEDNLSVYSSPRQDSIVSEEAVE
ncbi:hypothetical protein ACLOJK_013827 [Asimina triloba]